MKKLILSFLACFCLISPAMAEDISLYNLQGNAVAYIDTDHFVVYLWEEPGRPVAYVEPIDDSIARVWHYSGVHLGFYEAGVIYDNDGAGVCAVRKVMPITPKRDPKVPQWEQIHPEQPLRQPAPGIPDKWQKFSATPCELHLDAIHNWTNGAKPEGFRL